MAKIVGMNGGQQPPQQPKIDLKENGNDLPRMWWFSIYTRPTNS